MQDNAHDGVQPFEINDPQDHFQVLPDGRIAVSKPLMEAWQRQQRATHERVLGAGEGGELGFLVDRLVKEGHYLPWVVWAVLQNAIDLFAGLVGEEEVLASAANAAGEAEPERWEAFKDGLLHAIVKQHLELEVQRIKEGNPTCSVENPGVLEDSEVVGEGFEVE